jgi:hypothetical protein
MELSEETRLCRHCGEPFTVELGAGGRKPQYCSPEHQRAARSEAERQRRQGKREAAAAAAAEAEAAMPPEERAEREAEEEQARQRKAEESAKKKAERKRRKAAPLADAVSGTIPWIAPATDEFSKSTGSVKIDPGRLQYWQREPKKDSSFKRHQTMRGTASVATRIEYGLDPDPEPLPTRDDLEYVHWLRSLVEAVWPEEAA